MIQAAKDLHIVVGRQKNGQMSQYVGTAAGASDRFLSWSNNKDLADGDGDGDTIEPSLMYIMWYGKGRLIKYKNLI